MLRFYTKIQIFPRVHGVHKEEWWMLLLLQLTKFQFQIVGATSVSLPVLISAWVDLSKQQYILKEKIKKENEQVRKNKHLKK